VDRAQAGARRRVQEAVVGAVLTPNDPWAPLRRLTPARIGLGHTGGSLPTAAHLEFQLAHARARDAVHRALDAAALALALEAAGLPATVVTSAISDRTEYLQRPDLGRQLARESRERLAALAAPADAPYDVAFVAADGLSALAAVRHAVPVLARIVPRLRDEGWRVAPVIAAGQARVALGDEIGAVLGARLMAVLIGERPGLTSPDSLGIYVTWAPAPGRRDAERNCISNVRPTGLGYELAAGRLHFLLNEARRRKLTGVALKDDRSLPSSATEREPPLR
jgi:ethanolamine ammonia-lyase small subunit